MKEAEKELSAPEVEVDVKGLVEKIAKALVDFPDEVEATAADTPDATIIVLKTHKSDVGKIIGKGGRIIHSIHIIIHSIGIKVKRRFVLEVLQ